MTRIERLGRAAVVPLLAVFTAFLLGAVVIILTDFTNLSKLGSDPLAAIGGALGGVVAGYGAMLAGAFGDPARILAAIQTGAVGDIATAIRPLTETLVAATPLILTGLAVAISFRAGMFNIGVDGQLMIGALGATVAAFVLQGAGMPSAVILLGSIASGILSGAFWGFIPGFLKARTGAHEVITTIMLNYIAAQVVFFALRSSTLRAPGSTAPVSKPMWTFVDIPADPQPAGDPARLRVRDGAADGGRGLVPAVPDDQGLRAPCLGLQPDGRSLRRHERRRLDDARHGAVGRSRGHGGLVHGHRHGRPAVASTCLVGSASRRSRSPSSPGSGRAGSCSRRCCSARLTSGGKMHGHRDRDPVRPARVHHGAGHHVRGGADPDQVDVPDQA